MNEEPAQRKDPFVSVEQLLANAKDEAARQVAHWQSAN